MVRLRRTLISMTGSKKMSLLAVRTAAKIQGASFPPREVAGASRSGGPAFPRPYFGRRICTSAALARAANCRSFDFDSSVNRGSAAFAEAPNIPTEVIAAPRTS